jgi:hypothetical protein
MKTNILSYKRDKKVAHICWTNPTKVRGIRASEKIKYLLLEYSTKNKNCLQGEK